MTNPRAPQPEAHSLGSRYRAKRWWRDVAILLFLAAAIVSAVLWWSDRPVRQIEQLLLAEQFHQALTSANEFLRDHPQRSDVLEQKARALVGLKRWPDSISLFEQAGVTTQSGQRAWSLALLHQQRWSDAQPLLADLHQRNPQDAEVLHELIACDERLGNSDGALSKAARLMELPGQAARGALLLGTLHNNRLNRKQAIQAWQRVLELDPQAEKLQIPAHEFLAAFGRAYLLDGQPRAAIPILEQSLQAHPSPEAQVFLAEAFEQTGQVDRAIKLWNEALLTQPNSIKAREGLARTALANQRPLEALQLLSPMIDQPELASTTAYLIQRAHTQLGDKDAVTKWEQTVNRLRQSEQRRDLIETGIQRNPQAFWSQAVLAHQFAREGNRAQAARLLAPLMKTTPAEPFLRELADHLEKNAPLPSLDLVPLKQF